MDTQWPRWEVFKQDTPQKPHQAVGSVHAADPLHALLTARNVFVRRPQAVSLWVVRAEEVYAWTKEEIAEGLPQARLEGSAEVYLVFRKSSHKRSMTFVDFVGEVRATSPEAALQQALERFTDAEGLAWWVVPASRVYKSDESPETLESWFAPAQDKTYKQQQHYATVGSHVSQHKRRVRHGSPDEERAHR
ncbi:phenylacetic acid degradation protein [Meiothermus sp. QL-1]|uniref:phenylacetic acid degradation protein n=1 Tax=Meiothermus sp. QL-1 TaxID=2058095 RepID=UPI000E0A14D9|nr:phenylacetic acid degradation protein [Meiothermus sp. QL-1]RDI95052.1 phenylacetic acid degradation protein [Meiothermus sp. QL-1]